MYNRLSCVMANAGDGGSVPGSGDPLKGNGNPLHVCLGNPMTEWGIWQATVQLAKELTRF